MPSLKSLAANWRSLAVFGFDLLAVAISWVAAFYLSANLEPQPDHLRTMGLGLLVIVPVQAVIFRLAGLYRGIWIFSSLPDLIRILKAVGLSALLLAAGGIGVERTVLFLYPLLLLVTMTGGRASYRIWKEHSLYSSMSVQGQPVLVLGAGQAGARLVQELARTGEWRVVGFLDDEVAKQHREVMGRRVFGPINKLESVARKLSVRHAILAMPSASEEERQCVSQLCLKLNIQTFTVPSIEQLISGQDSLNHVRPINLNDLLGRVPVDIESPETLALVQDRVVMVTGAGGSIGSELCRQIARLKPAQLLLYENNEFALYTLHEELTERFPELPVLPLAGDVKDLAWLNELMLRYTPAVVFHAAAYKHVPLMEDHNAWQAIRNNVYGTYAVAIAALRARVPEFVLISTDKAVNPTNIMGASKRLAEMVCQALQNNQSATRFEIVRFGNVLGSTGSVIPRFQAQIRRGGPVTVTHPEITRFFMSIPEAAQLVLQAAAMGEGGEIFVLDMGKPIKIADLARQMIRLSGQPEERIPIVFTGLRPGEKLYEELLADDEQTRATHHPKVRIARARSVEVVWLDDILDWLKSPTPRSVDEVRRDLRRWVAEYQPANRPVLRPVPVSREG